MEDYLEDLLEMSLMLSPAEAGYVDADESDMDMDIDECASV